MAAGREQALFVGFLISWEVLTLSSLLYFVWAARPIAAAMTTLSASALLLPTLAVLLEGRSLGSVLNPRTQSWAFLFGDFIFLPLAAALLALAWGYIVMPDLRDTRWIAWIAGSTLLGLAAGAAFHWMDAKTYRAHGAGLALDSPTKLAHDFVSYPVLFGGLFCVGVPLLMKIAAACIRVTFADGSFGVQPAMALQVGLALGAVALWGLMGWFDVKNGLDPKNLHPAWSVSEFRAIPYPMN